MINVKEKEDVIRKIKKSLALANDKANEQESQTAMLMAQKLMAKHNLSMNDINLNVEIKKETKEGVGIRSGRIAWWQLSLSEIIAKNFRCYSYFYSGSRLVFFGLEQDVAIATEVFKFAVESIKYLASKYVKDNHISGYRQRTIAVKNDYILGFLSGLEDRFEEQVNKEDWGLVLVKDALVEQKYNEMELKSVKSNPINTMGDMGAKMQGYEDGKSFDHNKKALKEVR